MFDFISQKMAALFEGFRGNSITNAQLDTFLQGLRETLLEADVPYQLAVEFTEQLRTELSGQKITQSLKANEYLAKAVYDKLVGFLSGGSKSVGFNLPIPSTMMVLGLQGSGKTTSLGKLAHWIMQEAQAKGKKRRILLASVDYYRPAAIDQLEIVAKQAGVDFYRAQATDPVVAAREIYKKFQTDSYEYLMLDTAGRLHVDNAMLQELREIETIIKPKYKLIVLDSMTGQESLAIGKAFDQAIGFDGALMSKMDSDTRGGAVFSFRYSLKKPIVFVGMGEKVADLDPFNAERMAGRMLGMGDIVTLAEKAKQKITQAEQDSALKSLQSGQFTLKDFADQLEMMNRLGSLSQIAGYLPAMGGMRLNSDQLEKGEQELKKCKVIINSMTPKERIMPAILDGSRKKRVANGAGVSVEDVNLLLSRFEESKQYVKLFKKLGKFNFFK